MDPRPWTGQLLAAKAAWVHLFNTYNAAVQPQIRAQREFVGWNCLLELTWLAARVFDQPAMLRIA